ncbi:MBL fold metallo-hydrolase [Niveispirillum fermenti]|uniref:MBL fold metallo-hydrolase n=1 Tax=Niveispirillum fermenti TaxID=1233113 RepID=UPI003A8C6011
MSVSIHALPQVELPEVVQVATGIRSIRLPLPFALNHINVWVLDDRTADGQPAWAVVDTGVSSRLCRSLWEGLLEGPLADRHVSRVVVTHFHPDHIGLADWLCQRFGAPLWMSQAEWLLARMLHLDKSESFAEAEREFYASMALDPAMLAGLVERVHAYSRAVPGVPARHRRLQGGKQVRIGDTDWQIITSGGHSPEHACLYDPADRVLIAGDMVLPRISPNVSVWPADPESDPLAEFLDGLSRLRTLPQDTLVLPSHGHPFRDLHGRIDELVRHHQERLNEAEAACRDQPRTVADITRLMFHRPLDVHQMTFAAGEALAHLNHLVNTGRVTRSRRDDGVLLFAATR